LTGGSAANWAACCGTGFGGAVSSLQQPESKRRIMRHEAKERFIILTLYHKIATSRNLKQRPAIVYLASTPI